jgi:carbon storage regulator
MLVLSRRESESIQIGDAITIKVVLVAGRRVKLAIDAPREVRVLRGELQDELQNVPASVSPNCDLSGISALMVHAES